MMTKLALPLVVATAALGLTTSLAVASPRVPSRSTWVTQAFLDHQRVPDVQRPQSLAVDGDGDTYATTGVNRIDGEWQLIARRPGRSAATSPIRVDDDGTTVDVHDAVVTGTAGQPNAYLVATTCEGIFASPIPRHATVAPVLTADDLVFNIPDCTQTSADDADQWASGPYGELATYWFDGDGHYVVAIGTISTGMREHQIPELGDGIRPQYTAIALDPSDGMVYLTGAYQPPPPETDVEESIVALWTFNVEGVAYGQPRTIGAFADQVYPTSITALDGKLAIAAGDRNTAEVIRQSANGSWSDWEAASGSRLIMFDPSRNGIWGINARNTKHGVELDDAHFTPRTGWSPRHTLSAPPLAARSVGGDMLLSITFGVSRAGKVQYAYAIRQYLRSKG